MSKEYVNEMRGKRMEGPAGGAGKQGGHGSGKVKCSAQGGKSGSANFKSGSEMVGAPIDDERDVPGTSIMKGSSAVGYEGPRRGSDNPKSAGGKVRKPKAAEEAGH